MRDVGITVSQLRILLRIVRNKLGAKIFETKKMMNILSGDMILFKVGEYNYYNKPGSKPELILFLVRDIVAVYRKETRLLIDSGDTYIY